MWLFPLLLLAFASYARISLCLARGTESRQFKVQPIYSPMAYKEPPLFIRRRRINLHFTYIDRPLFLSLIFPNIPLHPQNPLDFRLSTTV
jgi:hypothetical protein